MAPDPHSPRSDPGLVHGRTGSNPTSEYPSCNDERFAYKNRRKERERKKPAFPKSGGPSILVYVKDDPRKNSNRNMQYQHYGLMPQFPLIPQVPTPPGFDPLKLPYLNPNLLMHMLPPLPPLPPHLLQNPFPQQRQRYNSSPTLLNYSNSQANYPSQQRQAANFTTNTTFTAAPNYPNPGPQTTSVPSSAYPNNSVYGMSAPTTQAGQFTSPPVTTLPFPLSYPTTTHPGLQYYSLPTVPYPVVGQRPPQQKPPQNLTPQNLTPQTVPVKQERLSPQSAPFKQDVSFSPQSVSQEQFLGNMQNGYETASEMKDFSSDSRTFLNPKYSPAQIPARVEQVDSSTQSVSPSTYHFTDAHSQSVSPPTYHFTDTSTPDRPVINPAVYPVYPNSYLANKCNCEQCQSQTSPTESGSSISTNDSGFADGVKGFPEFKDEGKDAASVLGERPLLYCDQDNPTFSLDPASLAHMIEMASSKNTPRNELMFQDEKRQIRKKIPCRNLSQTGMCQFGEACWFNHQLYNNYSNHGSNYSNHGSNYSN